MHSVYFNIQHYLTWQYRKDQFLNNDYREKSDVFLSSKNESWSETVLRFVFYDEQRW